jgi:glycosyltransferase involved in cell wall biosynthesis
VVALKVALVHDYLTQRGGAERVFLAMCHGFPEASIYTSLYEPDLTFPDFAKFDIKTTPLNHVSALRKHHRLALPFFATAFSRLTVDADVTICSSSGWAHGVRTTGAKIVYCHNTARWLYQTGQYAGAARSGSAVAMRLVGRPLRRWDARAASAADAYVANSEVVRTRVRRTYGLDATVVAPPVTLDPDGKQRAPGPRRDGFLLCVSRLLGYKNVEAVAQAFRQLPDQRLLVAGDGPMARHLRAVAPHNVEFLGAVTEPELRWLYAHCRALVAASYEDFGLTPVEAMSFGKPSVVLRWGGFLETVVDGETGVFFDEPSGRSIARAIRELDQLSFAPELLKKHAEEYSEAHFAERMRSIVATIANRADLARHHPVGCSGIA